MEDDAEKNDTPPDQNGPMESSFGDMNAGSGDHEIDLVREHRGCLIVWMPRSALEDLKSRSIRHICWMALKMIENDAMGNGIFGDGRHVMTERLLDVGDRPSRKVDIENGYGGILLMQLTACINVVNWLNPTELHGPIIDPYYQESYANWKEFILFQPKMACGPTNSYSCEMRSASEILRGFELRSFLLVNVKPFLREIQYTSLEPLKMEILRCLLRLTAIPNRLLPSLIGEMKPHLGIVNKATDLPAGEPSKTVDTPMSDGSNGFYGQETEMNPTSAGDKAPSEDAFRDVNDGLNVNDGQNVSDGLNVNDGLNVSDGQNGELVQSVQESVEESNAGGSNMAVYGSTNVGGSGVSVAGGDVTESGPVAESGPVSGPVAGPAMDGLDVSFLSSETGIGYILRDRGGYLEEDLGIISFECVTNDCEPNSLIKLLTLKSIFSRQLPKMPREYITRLTFDRHHYSFCLLKRNGPYSDYHVIGGVCFRPFLSKSFAEIVFLAVTSSEQVKGYGTRLMNHLKEFVRKRGLLYFLTYADNFALGYFRKQGFSSRITLSRDKWHGHIKDYEGGTLMECRINPKVNYLNLSQNFTRQKRLVHRATRLIKTLQIFPGSVLWSNVQAPQNSMVKLNPRTIPGFLEAGWNESLILAQRKTETMSLNDQIIKVVDHMMKHEASWPFRKPVTKQEAPDYYKHIKQPMDLSTIRRNAKNKSYHSKKEFVAHLKLIFDNCRYYNQPETIYYKLANELEAAIQSKVDDIEGE